MDLLENVYNTIEENRDNSLKGNLNGIPFAIPQLRSCIPIIKRGFYILITALAKHGSIEKSSRFIKKFILKNRAISVKAVMLIPR